MHPTDICCGNIRLARIQQHLDGPLEVTLYLKPERYAQEGLYLLRKLAEMTGIPFNEQEASEDEPMITISASELAATLATALTPVTRFSRQKRIAVWARSVFGEACMDVKERSLRFIEEAVELVQATGLSQEDVQRVVQYVYSRPVGHDYQEVGGVGCTLLALCEALVLDADALEVRELDRVTSTQNTERFRAKQNAKADAGVGMRTEVK